jgi:Mitosis protein DIM1
MLTFQLFLHQLKSYRQQQLPRQLSSHLPWSFHTFPFLITPNVSLTTDYMGSVVIPHLVSGWHVDQAIMSEDERLVVIRFGRDWDTDCMRQDEVLYSWCLPIPYPSVNTHADYHLL